MVFNFLVGFCIIWLSVLTIFIWKLWSYYHHLTQGEHTQTLYDLVNQLVTEQKKSKDKILQSEQSIQSLQKQIQLPIQKIGIVRFNPFADTGGSQSFVIALLDGDNSGIVMTSLYTRNGNRWYVKEIVAGKGQNIELAKEEQSAIKQAQGNII